MTAYGDLAALDRDHVMQTYGRQPVAFVRGSGTRLWDSEGNEYLDFLTGLATVSLGHAHPVVAAAIAEQAGTLVHVSNLYLNDVQPRLAERIDMLVTSATGTPGRVFFANSGAEANECAIKLARRFGQLHGGPDRFHLLSAYNSFHGRTLTTLAATGQPQKQETFQPLPAGFRHFEFGDLDALRAAIDDRVCAVMLEPVQGEGGIQPAPTGYLEAVRALCDEREVLLLMDEVQTGLGRTGRWFGFEHGGDVRPDVVTLAKALGNGMPIGACWAAGGGRGGVPPGRPRLDLRRAAVGGARRAGDPRRDGAGAGRRACRGGGQIPDRVLACTRRRCRGPGCGPARCRGACTGMGGRAGSRGVFGAGSRAQCGNPHRIAARPAVVGIRGGDR